MTAQVRTGVVLALVIAGLAAADQVLARTETREIQHEAAASFRRGSQELSAGRAAAAVDPLRKAHVLDRMNADYSVALGNALAAAGRTGEAAPLIADALNQKPADGGANLAYARLLAGTGRQQEAAFYYHRAIYGIWPDNAAQRRLEARFELVNLLEKEPRRQDLIAQLIEISADNPPPEAALRLGNAFLRAGSPQRAEEIFRGLADGNPENAEAWRGLGEALLAEGRYRDSRRAFGKADAGGLKTGDRIEMLSLLDSIDPTPRQLTSAEKFRRSRRLLEWTVTDMEQRMTASPGSTPLELTQLTDAARNELDRKAPAHPDNETAEALLQMAEKLWQGRVRRYGTDVSPDEEALRILMERLAA
jgi:tetratricopeptide (TPR) repeat protein